MPHRWLILLIFSLAVPAAGARPNVLPISIAAVEIHDGTFFSENKPIGPSADPRRCAGRARPSNRAS